MFKVYRLTAFETLAHVKEPPPEFLGFGIYPTPWRLQRTYFGKFLAGFSFPICKLV